MLRCFSCKILKPLTKFNKNKGNLTGYASYCKPCRTIHRRRELGTESGCISKLVTRSKTKARARGETYPKKGEHNIDVEFVNRQLELQKYKCYYSGLGVTFGHGDRTRASLERLDDQKGYTQDNTVIICSMFNVGSGRTLSRQKFEHVRTHNDRPMTRQEFDQQSAELESFARKLAKDARKNSRWRSKRRPHEDHRMTISYKFIMDLIWQQRGLCAYSDVRMVFRPNEPNWMASLERLDPTQGYNESNTALVCIEFNTHHQLDRDLVQSFREDGDTRKRRQIDEKKHVVPTLA